MKESGKAGIKVEGIKEIKKNKKIAVLKNNRGKYNLEYSARRYLK